MDREEYNFSRSELLKRKTFPYSLSNKEYALEFFEELKKEFPLATYYEFGISQYICFDNRAEKKLKMQLQDKLEDLLRDVAALNKVIESIK